MKSIPGMMWTRVKRRCRAKPASIAAASGNPAGAGEGAASCTIRRIATATPISAKKTQIVQRIRTIAGRGFKEALAVTPRVTPPTDPRGSPNAPANNTPTKRLPTAPPPRPLR